MVAHLFTKCSWRGWLQCIWYYIRNTPLVKLAYSRLTRLALRSASQGLARLASYSCLASQATLPGRLHILKNKARLHVQWVVRLNLITWVLLPIMRHVKLSHALSRKLRLDSFTCKQYVRLDLSLEDNTWKTTRVVNFKVGCIIYTISLQQQN